jgi:uncharacterized membrane protein
MRTDVAPEWVRRQIDKIETSAQLDAPVGAMSKPAEQLSAGTAGDVLRGRWLGHALHPLLTDFPLGCWIGAGLLDLVGGRSARRAAQRLVGLGLVFVPATAASGLADWSGIEEQPTKRVGAAHALGNTVVATLYLLSWRARRKGHHLRGVGLGLVGGTLAWATGYLGGHMSFGRSAGVGERGLSAEPAVDGATATGDVRRDGRHDGEVSAHGNDDVLDAAQAAEILTVGPEQLQAMIDGGLLVPVSGSGANATFSRNDVIAARSVGG